MPRARSTTKAFPPRSAAKARPRHSRNRVTARSAIRLNRLQPYIAEEREKRAPHLVGDAEQRRRDFEAERFGRFQVDEQLILIWVLHRQVGRLLVLEDAGHIGSLEAKPTAPHVTPYKAVAIQ